jgi:nucleotide-binding universal stress UspA family protein
MASGPVVIGYDGSESADLALRRAAELLAPRQAVVVVVWEAGETFEAAMLPTSSLGFLPAPLDFRRAMETDRAMYEHAQQLAERGAELGRELGLDAEGLAVADDITVGDTLIRLAIDNDSQAIVVGAHGHSALGDLLLGHTSQTVVRHAPCPVVVVRRQQHSAERTSNDPPS